VGVKYIGRQNKQQSNVAFFLETFVDKIDLHTIQVLPKAGGLSTNIGGLRVQSICTHTSFLSTNVTDVTLHSPPRITDFVNQCISDNLVKISWAQKKPPLSEWLASRGTCLLRVLYNIGLTIYIQRHDTIK
jgi:hypothetical protein